jgi:RNA recognition motif. (a.k.a. RRM, RBD, or RNP domain)
VKVPVGKHCGFVQFVRKADAERAIEKMQGFPVGGSRIRLSWGRSQCPYPPTIPPTSYANAVDIDKAAQAAAQAAQAAALQPQFSVSAALPGANMMTQEQAIQLLQKLNIQGYFGNTATAGSNPNVNEGENSTGYNNAPPAGMFGEHKIHPALLTATRDEGSSSYDSFSSNAFPSRPEIHRSQSQFAPFSPDPNAYASELKRHDSRADMLLHPPKVYAPGFYPLQTQDLQMNSGVSAGSASKTSPTSARPASASAGASRYNSFLESSNHSFPVNRAPGRPEAPVSRPTSGQTAGSAPRIEQGSQELDAMHDLNGTLASLELDRPWKSPVESTGSGAAVRGTNEKAPLP